MVASNNESRFKSDLEPLASMQLRHKNLEENTSLPSPNYYLTSFHFTFFIN